MRPYNRYQIRRHLLHHASEAAIKFRGQVVARGAERQRRFIVRLKTGGRFQDTFIRARATAAALGVPRLDEHQSTKAAPRPGVLRWERIRAVPPQKGG